MFVVCKFAIALLHTEQETELKSFLRAARQCF